MIYKANYCCECGEKIERISDGLLSRSKFCDICSPHFKTESYIKRAILGAGLLGTIFGVGSLLKKTPQPQMSAQKNEFASVVVKPQFPSNTKVENKNLNEARVLVNQKNGANHTNEALLKKETVASLKTVNEEIVETIYFCGAKTKKGTACSRKVKNHVRCWQHEGETAVLPQNKLIASQ
jgi:hypothetical protein